MSWIIPLLPDHLLNQSLQRPTASTPNHSLWAVVAVAVPHSSIGLAAITTPELQLSSARSLSVFESADLWPHVTMKTAQCARTSLSGPQGGGCLHKCVLTGIGDLRRHDLPSPY